MTIENGIRVLAGSLVFVSGVCSFCHSQWWLLFALFVSINLIQSAFTGFCPASKILKILGFKDSGNCCSKQ